LKHLDVQFKLESLKFMLNRLAVIALFVASKLGVVPARSLPQSGIKAFFVLTFENS
jgi:hypothetical protein